MINLNKVSLILAVTVGGALASALPSLAQSQTEFASITGISAGASNSSNVFTYTPGAAGGFSITNGALFAAEFLGTPFSLAAPVNVSFSGLTNVGTLTGGPTTYDQTLSGGSFTVTSGTDTLLSGTFGGGNLLEGTVGSTTTSLTNTLTNVTFTGGTYFEDSGLSNPGAFSIALQGVNPAVAIDSTGSYFTGFAAGGTGNFTASTVPPAVPEPATVVPFLLGGLGLLALAVRKTRRSSVPA